MPETLKLLGKNGELQEISDEAESILKELGVSSNASRSFLSIAESSPMTAASVCQKTGIADSKIYYALQELEDLGVIVKIAGTPQLYSAQTPSEVSASLGNIIETEQKRKAARVARLEKILRPLLKTTQRQDNLEIAYIARGFDNVVRRASKLLSSAEKQVVGYLWTEEIYSTLAGELDELALRGIDAKLAINRTLSIEQPVSRKNLPVLSNSLRERKLLKCACNLFVVDNKKMITITKTVSKNYYAIITEDPGMISLGTSYYDNPSCCVSSS